MITHAPANPAVLAQEPPVTRGASSTIRGDVPLYRVPILMLAALGAGAALRLVPWAAFQGKGFDEALYERYLKQLLQVGLWNYPDIVEAYLSYQKTLTGSILPPTRFLYIFFAWLWHGVTGAGPLASFYAVARVFSLMNLGLGTAFAWRLGGRSFALGVGALLAFSPLQVHMAQHALVDGVFAFWAMLTLWALWENLQRPGHRGWLAVYTLGLAAMVTCKENAFFVWTAILALLAANRWLYFGRVSRPLLVLTGVGPLVGVAVLVNLAGGVGTLISVYTLGVSKNMQLEYAVLTGDGPWHRYLLDLLALSPLVLLLAVGAALGLRRGNRVGWFLLIFVAASYALMCNVRYGMNLRYATIWDLPLRALAFGQAALLCRRWATARWAGAVLVAVVVGLCAFDVYQYYRLAIVYPLYELVPQDLLRALKVLK